MTGFLLIPLSLCVYSDATVPVATTSRSTRTAKLTKDKRGQK